MAFTHAPSTHPSRYTVQVRFADGRDDVPLILSPTHPATVQDIRHQLVSQDPSLQGKYLRLLHHGRILQSHKTIESLLASLDLTALSNPVFIHCSISDTPPQNINEQPQLTRRAQGFDRLVELGMSEQEVQDLRTQFHALRGHNPDELQEDSLNIEEDWMDNPGIAGQTPETLETHSDMLIGLMVGFFMGILAIYWIKEARMYNRQQQLGIITGLIINFSFGALRLCYYDW